MENKITTAIIKLSNNITPQNTHGAFTKNGKNYQKITYGIVEFNEESKIDPKEYQISDTLLKKGVSFYKEGDNIWAVFTYRKKLRAVSLSMMGIYTDSPKLNYFNSRL